MSTTTFDAAVTAIRNHLTTNWTHADVPILWPNEDNRLPDNPAALVYVEVLDEIEELVGLGQRGSNLWRNHGRVEAHVFVPKNTGTATLDTYCKEIAAIFRGASFSEVQFFDAVVSGGDTKADDGNYFGRTVIADFQFDTLG